MATACAVPPTYRKTRGLGHPVRELHGENWTTWHGVRELQCGTKAESKRASRDYESKHNTHSNTYMASVHKQPHLQSRLSRSRRTLFRLLAHLFLFDTINRHAYRARNVTHLSLHSRLATNLLLAF